MWAMICKVQLSSYSFAEISCDKDPEKKPLRSLTARQPPYSTLACQHLRAIGRQLLRAPVHLLETAAEVGDPVLEAHEFGLEREGCDARVHGKKLPSQVGEEALYALELRVDQAYRPRYLVVDGELPTPALERRLERRPERTPLLDLLELFLEPPHPPYDSSSFHGLEVAPQGGPTPREHDRSLYLVHDRAQVLKE